VIEGGFRFLIIMYVILTKYRFYIKALSNDRDKNVAHK